MIQTIEEKILEALQRGPCTLVTLAERTNVDAQQLSPRLHVMADHRQVRSTTANGHILWESRLTAHQQATQPPAPAAATEAMLPKPQPEAPAKKLTESRPPPETTGPKPVKPTEAPVPTPARKRRKAFVVRPYVPAKPLITAELINSGAGPVIIAEQFEGEDKNREGDGIAIEVEDLPALIAALSEIMACAAVEASA